MLYSIAGIELEFSLSFYLEALTQDGPILLGMRIYQDFYAYESGQGHVHAHGLAWFILDC